MATSIGAATSANPAAAAPAATAKTAEVSLGENLNQFLTMLTTQLKNQDPLSPLDTNQFTQQLVSFSQVEQAIKTNSQLGSLVSMMSTSAIASSVPLVGKKVEVDSPEIGLTDGKAEFAYELPAKATESALVITDIAGNIVWTGAGEAAAGRHEFTWDGRDSLGRPVPDGTYRLDVGAARVDGTPMTAKVTSSGVVGGILVKDGQASLAIGTAEIPTAKLVGVRN
jgi:flagellar basal-body rod modification protein FlgD